MTAGPQTFCVNGERRPWSACTVAELAADEGVPPDRRGVAIAVNGEVVARGAWDTTTLVPGDRVEIVRIVRGG